MRNHELWRLVQDASLALDAARGAVRDAGHKTKVCVPADLDQMRIRLHAASLEYSQLSKRWDARASERD
jgi:hypothetical protein